MIKRTIYVLLQLESVPWFPQLNNAGETDIIRGALNTVSLSSSPQYAALSYTWPNDDEVASPQCTIDCGKYQIKISRNCFDALQCIRRKRPKLPIWVDAVCIDQRDTNEKTHQVRLMDEIYSRAQIVYIWLGQSKHDSDSAMHYLSTIAKEMRCLDGLSCVFSPNVFSLQVLWDFLTGVQFRYRGRDRQSHQRRPFEDPSKPTRTGKMPLPIYIDTVQAFLDLRWFSRGWTFQEVVLAVNPVILCGPKTLDWNTFVCGIARLSQDALDYPSEFLEYAPNLFAMMSLIHLWMSIDRPTVWNGRMVRRSTEYGSSFDAYQTAFQDLQLWWNSEALMQAERWTTRSLFLLIAAVCLYRRSFDAYILASSVFAMMAMLNVSKDTFGLNANVPSSTLSLPYDFWQLSHHHSDYTRQGYRGVVQALRGRDVGDSKDKSYALYGVLDALGLPKLSNLDYQKPLHQVYKELFQDLLEWNSKSLDLILDAGLPSLHEGTASWIPRWDRPRGQNWLDIAFLLGDHRRLDNDRDSGFGTKEYRRSYEIAGSQLIVRGRPRNHPVYCRPVPPSVRIHPAPRPLPTDPIYTHGLEVIALVLGWFSKIAKYTSPKAWPANELLRGLFYILVLNRRYRSAVYHPKYRRMYKDRAVSTMFEPFEIWFRIINNVTHIPIFYEHPELHHTLPHVASERSPTKIVNDILANPEAHQFHTYLCQRLEGNRCLFVTKKGFFGTGPLGMRATDHLYRIEGMAADVVLRDPAVGKPNPRDESDTEAGKFLLVGPALTCFNTSRNKNLRNSTRASTLGLHSYERAF